MIACSLGCCQNYSRILFTYNVNRMFACQFFLLSKLHISERSQQQKVPFGLFLFLFKSVEIILHA